jgi:3-dehydroquinate dehydratase-2
MHTILVIHGPNLNLLGIREPSVYGKTRLEDINNAVFVQAQAFNISITCVQFNAEHEIISRLHHTIHEQTDLIILNPAAFTHTSIAIRDALLAIQVPFIEVHLSNVHKREPFRHHSYFSDIAIGTIGGFGAHSYVLALHAAHHYLTSKT